MDRRFMPASNDTKGPDYCGTPLNRNPFPLPNHVVPRHAVPPRFVSPPGPFEASPLCPPPALEGLRYRSPPNHSPGVPLSPFGSRGDPFYNSPFGMCDPSASFGTPSSASSFSNAGNFRHGGHRSWNGTPNNGKEFRRGMKRSTPNVHQHGGNNGNRSDCHLYYSPSMLSHPWAGLTPVPVSRH